jgi:tetratricopeptide (TPR) repeat protein
MDEGEGAIPDKPNPGGHARSGCQLSPVPAVPPWLPPLVLALAVVAVYAPSLSGGFLNYDDDWLIENNPIVRRTDLGALRPIWTDLGPETRQRLGAEYLPVRDTLMWFEVRLFGLSPHALRAVSLLLYLAAALALRAYLRATIADPTVADLAAFLFALHPVHVESVAWLAGQKDLCALLLVAAALCLYARARALWAVPLLLLLAMFAKGVAVTVPLLLPCHDWLVRRRPRWAVIGAALVAAAIALVVHLRVGRAVGMLAPWPGGGRLATAATMGPIWLRYLTESFVPTGLTIRHEVTVHRALDLAAWAGYLPLVALAAAAAAVARHRRWRLPAFALAWFVIPLLPTSHVVAPLQNLMADRYLLLAVLGPCLVLAAACRRVPAGLALAAAVLLMFGALTLVRARVFAGSIPLWTDAVAKQPASARAHYQLAMALRQAGHPADAELALRRALAVAAPDDDTGRRAANNLAGLLAASGRLREAQVLLQETVARFPGDPRALGNLAEITARLGQQNEARRLFETLRRRFPQYEPGQRNFRLHFAPATPPAATAGPQAPSPSPDR